MDKNFSDIIELNDLRYYFLILFMLKEMQIYIYIYDTNIYIYNTSFQSSLYCCWRSPPFPCDKNKGFTSSHRFIELSTHQLENCILSIEKKKDKRLKSVNKIVVAAGGVRLSVW